MTHLDEMLYQASIATKNPKDPEGGIPKQWLPGFIRWPLRVLFYPFVVLDEWAQKVAKKLVKPPFERAGACKKRGNCCHYILIKQSWGFLGYLDLFWNTQVNGFFLRSKKTHEFEGKKVYVLGCRYLKKDGSCGHYRLRPSLCRSWPRIEVFERPQMLKGCGFFARNRKTGEVLGEEDSWDQRFSVFDKYSKIT